MVIFGLIIVQIFHMLFSIRSITSSGFLVEDTKVVQLQNTINHEIPVDLSSRVYQNLLFFEIVSIKPAFKL